MVRRNEEGPAMLMTTPWYVKAISTVGVPAAIALYLVYYMTSVAPTKADVLAFSGQLQTHIVSTQSDLTEIRRILIATCINAAKAPEDRNRCVGSAPAR